MEQAHGVFEVGLTEFPMAAGDDPEYGRFIEGRRYDNPVTGAVFGVSRTSRYPEAALDFLLFVASQKGNEQFNESFGWLPAIKGSKPPKDLAGFVPHFDGVQIVDNTVIGGDSWTAWSQEMSDFRTNDKMTVQQLAANLERRYCNDCNKDWVENQMQGRRRGLTATDSILTGMRLQALEAQAAEAGAADPQAKAAAARLVESAWIKYRVLSTTQEINQEVLTARQLALYKERWIPADIGLTEYTPQAQENIRKNASLAPKNLAEVTPPGVSSSGAVILRSGAGRDEESRRKDGQEPGPGRDSSLAPLAQNDNAGRNLSAGVSP